MGFIISIGLAYWFTTEWYLVSSTEPTAWSLSPKGDCAVVLTGGPGRVRDGFDLLVQGRVRKLLISGVNPKSELREIFPEWPFYGSISAEDVVLERRSATTYGNAQQTLALVEALGCKSIVLITSRAHMYRALKIFTAIYPLGFDISPRATVSGSLSSDKFDLSLEAIKSMFYSLWAY